MRGGVIIRLSHALGMIPNQSSVYVTEIHVGRMISRPKLETFRFRHPVRVGAQLAVFAHEHLAGFLVSLQLPPGPTRGDVSPLAAAGVIDGRRVAGALPCPVERWQ